MLDGRSEHMPVSELAGGARIRHIFQVCCVGLFVVSNKHQSALSSLHQQPPIARAQRWHAAPSTSAHNAGRFPFFSQEIFNAGLEELDPTRWAFLH